MSSPRRFSVSALVEAPPQEVYAIFADYHHAHPAILPRPPFVSLEVETGGTGAGTVIFCRMRVLGRVQTFRATVEEPEPGRVLRETTDTGYVTTFTVDPREGGRHSWVTIATEVARRGVPGALEGWFAGRLLRPVYARELRQAAALAAERASRPPLATTE